MDLDLSRDEVDCGDGQDRPGLDGPQTRQVRGDGGRQTEAAHLIWLRPRVLPGDGADMRKLAEL